MIKICSLVFLIIVLVIWTYIEGNDSFLLLLYLVLDILIDEESGILFDGAFDDN